MNEPNPSTSPYLEGNYAPIGAEIETGALEVIGEIPRDLAGFYVRTGSNPRFAPRGRYHWFDGDGMLHGVEFDDGVARYRNRWIRTEGFLAEESAGQPLWGGVTERADLANPRGPLKDTANTDVVFHAGRLLALWWLGGKAFALRIPSLDTCGIETFGDTKGRTISAHPKRDPVTGELMFFDFKPFPPYLTYGVVSDAGELAHVTHVELPGPRLQHDMAITEHYSVLLDMPMMWDPARLAHGETTVIFERERPMRFGLLPRRGDGAKIRWFEASPGYMYHTINAWEEGDRVVVIGCRIERPLRDPSQSSVASAQLVVPTIGFLRLEPYLYRWEFHLRTGAVAEEKLDDRMTEFPRMDDRRLGRLSRYSYNARLARTPTLLLDGVVKYDWALARSSTHAYPPGWYGGEVAFAPRAEASEEDCGYLLTFVVEEATGASELYVLDAAAIDRAPLARVKIPARVPTGFHSRFIPRADYT